MERPDRDEATEEAERLRQELRRYAGRWLRWSVAVVFVAFVACAYLGRFAIASPWTTSQLAIDADAASVGLAFGSVGAVLAAVVSMYWSICWPKRRRHRLASLLGAARGIRTLNVLCATDEPDSAPHWLRIAIANAITSCSEGLTAADAAEATAATRSAVTLRLRTTGMVGIFTRERRALALLNALGHIGDRASLDYVERLARRPPAVKDREAIRGAAVLAAQRIRARIAALKGADVLLRPAATPDTTLLRPAMGVSESDASTLLRPAAEPGEDLRPGHAAPEVREQAEIHGTT